MSTAITSYLSRYSRNDLKPFWVHGKIMPYDWIKILGNMVNKTICTTLTSNWTVIVEKAHIQSKIKNLQRATTEFWDVTWILSPYTEIKQNRGYYTWENWNITENALQQIISMATENRICVIYKWTEISFRYQQNRGYYSWGNWTI